MKTLKNIFLKHPLAFPVVLSGLFSLVYILFSIHVHDDQAVYYAPMARAFARGQWQQAFIDFIPPLQPVLAGLLCKIGLHPVKALQIVSGVFFVGSVFPIFFILKHILKRSDWAGLATLMYVLAPIIIFASCNGLLNAGRNFFVMFSIWMVISFLKNRRWDKIALLGVSMAGLATIRGEGIAYAPFMLLWLWIGIWAKDRKFSAKFWLDSIKYSALTIAVMITLLLPRMIQVYKSTGIPVVDYRQVEMVAEIFNIENRQKVESDLPTPPRPGLLSAEKINHVITQFSKGSYTPYLILAIAGIVIVWRKKEFQIAHWMLLTTVVFTFLLFYPLIISKRYYTVNIPLLCGFSFITLKLIYDKLSISSIHLKRTAVITLIVIGCVQSYDGLKNIRRGSAVYEKRVGQMIAERYVNQGRELLIASDHAQYALWADCKWMSITADAEEKLYPDPDEIKYADIVVVLKKDTYLLKPLEKLAFLKPTEHDDTKWVTVFKNIAKGN